MDQMVEDVEWLLTTGETPLRWPERVGSPSAAALNQTLRRAERPDLATHLDSYC